MFVRFRTEEADYLQSRTRIIVTFLVHRHSKSLFQCSDVCVLHGSTSYPKGGEFPYLCYTENWTFEYSHNFLQLKRFVDMVYNG